MLASHFSKQLPPTARMATAVTEIPTVALLYRLKRLSPPSSSSATPSQVLNNKIGIFRGDITKLQVDAIVNAANKYLRGGGGVDGAIHRAAGRDLLAECRSLGGCATGSAKITSAYNLPCKKVIHAVGPIYDHMRPEESAALLASCYTTSLQLAVDNGCKSMAFSGISTGIYGYPSQDAASVATKAVREFMEGADGEKIEKVIFCTFEDKDVKAYDDWTPRVFPPTQQDLKGTEAKDEAKNTDEAMTNSPERNPDLPNENVEMEKAAGSGDSIISPEVSATIDDLPTVPATEPSIEGEPVSKRQKPVSDSPTR